jgi:hypothetical protein
VIGVIFSLNFAIKTGASQLLTRPGKIRVMVNFHPFERADYVVEFVAA